MTPEDEAQHRYLQLLLQSGCKPMEQTTLMGKSYVWLRSPAGERFLERLPNGD